MPRGDNPNSRKNLIPFSERTEKEQRKIRQKAGVESGKARALKKTLNESLKELCTPEVLEELNQRLIQMARRGNLKAYEILRDGLGENPKDKISKEQLKLRKQELEQKKEGW